MIMIYVKDIPLEIWFLIFDFTLDTSVTPQEIRNYHNFPQINRHLRSPRSHPPVDSSWGNLRLVCQAFKTLAGNSPHCFVRRERGFDIPPSARAAYIGVFNNVMGCMEHLTQSPIKHHQIVTLNITHGYSQNPNSEGSLAFLQYARILPNLRTLALDLTSTFDAFSTWRRINDAFPFLTCLVLRGEWSNTYTYTPPVMVEPTVFEHVEILELDRLIPGLGAEFPRLRFLSLERFSENGMKVVAGWPSIEALLLRGVKQTASFDWKQLPNLRMLGLPSSHSHLLSGCPVGHPWSNLCISVPPNWAARHVNPIIERLPSTTRLVINLELINPADLDLIARGCAAAGLELADSPHNRFQRTCMYIGTKIPPSVAYAFTQGMVDAVITGLFCCFLCGAELATCCRSLRHSRRQN